MCLPVWQPHMHCNMYLYVLVCLHIKSFKLFLVIKWEFRRNIPEIIKNQWENQHFRPYLGKVETPYKTCRKWTFCRKTFAQVGRTMTAPRAGAPFAGRSLLPRWGTRVIQETPQWLPVRAPSATLGPCGLIIG